ncbi:MAG: DUF5995 family protein [Acidimicrobiia bacterium]
MAVPDIEVVLERIEGVITETERARSRAGYFAAMYRKVTVAVRDAIVAGRFDDNDRMARLDRVFAERYLDAYDLWRDSGHPTTAWQMAFDASLRWRPIIIQHLLVGMNAHINLDLGIAAATVAPGSELAGLRSDFDLINNILGELVDGFMDAADEVSPWVGLLDRFGGRTDQTLVRFSIEIARRRAWELAVQLANAAPDAWGGIIASRDTATAELAGAILAPGPILPAGLVLIRLRESNDVARVIEVLGADRSRG